jgi:hypothetical protein
MAFLHSRSHVTRVGVAGVLSVLCAARAASAQQDATQSPAALAEGLITRGVAARGRGEDDAALADFRRAYALTPTARVQGQIALAEQALGLWSDAERDLQQALAVASDPWIQRNAAALQQALVGLQARLATLDVRTDVPGVQVRINERQVATTPLAQPLRVAAGTVVIDVLGDRYVAQRRTIELAPRAVSREVFTMVSRSVTTVEPQPPVTPVVFPTPGGPGPVAGVVPRPPAPRVSWVGPAIVTGAGAAGLASAAVFAVLRNTALQACPFDDARMGLVCATSESYSVASAGPTWTTATNVTLIAGSALVVGGGVWFAINAVTARSSERTTARRWWTAPIATSDGVSLMAGGAL